METYPDFLMENLEDLLVRTPLEHITMRDQHLNRLPTRARRLQVQHTLRRAEILRTLVVEDDVLDLVHKDVDPCVETLSDGVVKGRLEALLLANDGVEEVLLVDVRGLHPHPSSVRKSKSEGRGRGLTISLSK